MRKSLLSLLALLPLMLYAKDAQTESDKTVTYPQIFIGAQGGIQTTLTHYNNWQLVKPTTSMSVGTFFTPVIGARLHFNGFWNEGGYYDETEDFKYKYKYFTSCLDIMINLVNLFSKKSYNPVGVYLLGGLGLNCAWDNDEAYARRDVLRTAYEGCHLSHNARIGTMIDYSISRHVSINLELAANCLNDKYNSKLSGKSDWQLTTQLGVAYKFAGKKSKKAAEPKEVWETRQDTIWYDSNEKDAARKFRIKDVHYRVK